MATAPAIIMLVEDDPGQAEAIMISLRRVPGVRQIIWLKDTTSAEECLERSCRNRLTGLQVYPQLLLLSINLADGGALCFLRNLKMSRLTRRIPVIMLVNTPCDKDLANGYAYGANSFMVKPVTPDGIGERLAEFELFWALTEKLPPIVGGPGRSE